MSDSSASRFLTAAGAAALALFLILPGARAQTTWIQRTSGTTNGFNNVFYNGTQFFAYTANEPVVTSPDGITWTASSLTFPGNVTYSNGTYYAINSENIYTSSNGITWTERFNTSLNSLESLAVGNGIAVGVGTAGYIVRSTDGGQTWNTVPSPNSQTMYGVTFGNGLFLAVGNSGAAVYSSDGYNWTLTNTTTETLYNVAYGAGFFVAVGNGGTAAVFLSTGRATFSESVFSTAMSCITYGNGLFVATGTSGSLYTSPDASTWTARTSGVNWALGPMACNSSEFVVVGANGTILTSSTGVGTPPLVPTVNISSAVQLNWQSQTGRVYQVQSSPDLSTWTNVGATILGDGLSKTFDDPTASAAKKYYRIQIQ